MRDDAWFERLKKECRGLLSLQVYRRLYEAAAANPDKDALEVGTGRGASTIAIAAGIKDAGGKGHVFAVDQFYQGRIKGPHKYSLKTGKKSDVIRQNVEVFNANMAAFDVADTVTAVVGRSDEVTLPANRRFGFLFIDVDGMIDRDFALFYDKVDVGATIVLDDIGHTDDRLGEAHFGGESIEAYRDAQTRGEDFLGGLTDYQRKRLLGKHYLGSILVDYFAKAGLIRLDEFVVATAFCTKTRDTSTPHDLFFDHDAEARVVAEFLSLARA